MLVGSRMNESTPDATWVGSIDLAQWPDFDLGLLRVRPARCEVEWNGASRSLQRRVMQVLVAQVATAYFDLLEYDAELEYVRQSIKTRQILGQNSSI